MNSAIVGAEKDGFSYGAIKSCPRILHLLMSVAWAVSEAPNILQPFDATRQDIARGYGAS